MSKTLLIIGASGRAAAMSAVRSGFEPWAADRFGDLDLQACAESIRIEDYPAGLERALAGVPDMPWIYTGAMENRPELIDRISRGRKLYGIGGESLRAVRDPFRVAAALSQAGLQAPRCTRSAAALPRDGSWLCKPLASAGGCGVRPLLSGPADDFPPHDAFSPGSCPREAVGMAPSPDPASSSLKPQASSLPPQASSPSPQGYFQQRIEGTPVGAVFVAAERRATLLGVTRQLVGLDWCGLPAGDVHRFRYCGSIGPLRLNAAMVNRFMRIGNVLAEAFDLRGLFGVDAIIVGDVSANAFDGEIWPLEVNPRYTASVEVLERALGIPSMALHVAAFDESLGVGPRSVQVAKAGRECCGKAILFATVDTIVSRGFAEWCQQQNRHGERPTVADLPAGCTPIQRGQPIISVLAAARDAGAVLERLKSLAKSAYRAFAGSALKA